LLKGGDPMKVRVRYQGREVEGEAIEWDEVTPGGWAEFRCDGGIKVKVRPNVKRIVRLDLPDGEGEPVYVADMLEPAVVVQFPRLIV
jgi:hypothetical protein